MFCGRCIKCNKEFETKKRNQRFCSKSCSNSFNASARKIEDNSIFETKLNKVSAYILGLIYSDGCLSYDAHTKRNRITISMNEKELIEKLNKIMTPNKKVYKYKHPKGRNYTYSVISTNPTDIKYLLNIGITERKSSIVIMPKLPRNLLGHFIRGYFDGDGSVYKNKTSTYYNGIKKYYVYKNVSFTTGSKVFAEELRLILDSFNIDSNIVKDSRSDHRCWYVKIYKSDSVNKFYNLIYSDADYYLDRKHSKFIEMI